MDNNILLSVSGLSVVFRSERGDIHAVNDLSYDIKEGEILGIIGESGSGKSTSAYAITGLLPKNGRVTSGSISFSGRDILGMPYKELRNILGKEISMIFQAPMDCIDPSFTIGSQLIELCRAHEKVSREEARGRAIEMLKLVRISDPELMMDRYQHELSGGMCQRVMIAMALLLKPKLLIADEPTTALDVTIQEQILSLIKSFSRETGMSVIFITHNFGIVADICDRVCVMYGGRAVEAGTVEEIFYDHRHPYTAGLLKAIPDLEFGHKEPLYSIPGGDLPRTDLAEGCPFYPRCEYAACCSRDLPEYTRISETHIVACRCREKVKEAENE